MKNNPTVLVLGGYGGTGQLFCRYLLKETGVHVIVAGRRLGKAEEFADKLKEEFPPERISARHADASETESLRTAFRSIDFLLVAATTANRAKQVAEAALEAGADYLDIYFQQDAWPALQTLVERIERAGRCFITQAGFHPGLPAAFVRHGAQYFDRYDRAIVAFSMNAKIDRPESAYEIVDAVADYKPEFYQNGNWKTGTYKDSIKIDYGSHFGIRYSMPLDLVEIRERETNNLPILARPFSF